MESNGLALAQLIALIGILVTMLAFAFKAGRWMQMVDSTFRQIREWQTHHEQAHHPDA
tara:strand:- start:1465 stop:1638 length:174 start_codon:yes stop_codon:yes gene_type:complete